MKEYSIPFEKRFVILVVLGSPFLFKLEFALAIFLPLAAWMIWGDWREIQVNREKLRFRTFWFGTWHELDWNIVDKADWVGFDTASLSLSDGKQCLVSYAGLSDADRSEVSGWINHCCPSGLRRVSSNKEMAD